MGLGPGRQAGILVVDDDSSSAQALVAVLRDEGHEALVASSGAKGIVALASGAVRLLILDPALKDRSGPHVLQCARDLGVPAIVATSGPEFDPERASDGAASGFVYKPIHLPTLLGLIATALDQQGGRRPGRPAAGTSGPGVPRRGPRSAGSG